MEEIVCTITGTRVTCAPDDAARLVEGGLFAFPGGHADGAVATEDAAEARGEEERGQRKPLRKMNKPELLALASEMGVAAPEGATNAALCALLSAAGAR